MPTTKNALIRYKTIDNCLQNHHRRWSLQDLVDACSDALYEFEGKDDLVSTRTVQLDIQMMRSDKLGYYAPIEVYKIDRKSYYRYSDPEYTITNLPLSAHDVKVLSNAIDLLRQYENFRQFSEMSDVIGRLQDQVAIAHNKRPIVDFERNENLMGLKYLTPLYDMIANRQTIHVVYRPFAAREDKEMFLFPYLLKEYRNRWFVFGCRPGDMKLLNLALDRIQSVVVSESIPYKESPDFNPDTYFNDVVGVTYDNHIPVKTVRIWADRKISKYILTKPIHSSQTLIGENPEDGSMTFEMKVALNYEFYTVLLGYGEGVKVLSPKKVVRYMRDTFQKCLANYEEKKETQDLDGADFR